MSIRVGIFEPLTIAEVEVVSRWVQRKRREYPKIIRMVREEDETVLKACKRNRVKRIAVIPHPYFAAAGKTAAFGMTYILVYKGRVYEVESDEAERMWVSKQKT